MRLAGGHYADINLLRFLVSFCLLLLCAGGFLYFQDRNSDSVRHVAAEQIKGNFFLAVANIRMQAKQQGRVSEVTYQQRRVAVNKHGKPAVTDSRGNLDCQQIWRQVMGRDIRVAGQPVSALRLKTAANGEVPPQGCRYRADNLLLLDYFP